MMMGGRAKMYKVSEFSEITGLSKETLRYYAEVKHEQKYREGKRVETYIVRNLSV
jgi:hypothetical protein